MGTLVIAPRVIPVLQIDDGGWLVKTRQYRSPRYLGDPINAVKIFNEKQVDELVVVDIAASRSRRDPAYDVLTDIASEAFMPVAYGGGLRSVDQARRVVNLGIEKVIVNSALFTAPEAVEAMAAALGSQSVVASIDVRRGVDGELVTTSASGTRREPENVGDVARRAVGLGAGEIILSAVDREGTREGYDLEAIRLVAEVVPVPLVALGGSGSFEDFVAAILAGADAVAAGSQFVFYGRRDAVLITYPEPSEVAALMKASPSGTTY
ncbi:MULTISPECIES: HisA/HisF-related TIM barrel protein [Microbacterium]|uniref:HisA/HisF-related TIM barrel protein n=1 Tax=Microbacterium TaxID=33882 RepID=UPI00190F899F|nr:MULTISPECIES: HisA/HisF-related TIM barrel protein [Microbacterium]